jgi:hypothetical protein
VNRGGVQALLSWLTRVFWHWCELVGQCLDYGYPDALPGDDRWAARLPAPGEEYIADGIRQLERYVELRSRRPWH